MHVECKSLKFHEHLRDFQAQLNKLVSSVKYLKGIISVHQSCRKHLIAVSEPVKVSHFHSTGMDYSRWNWWILPHGKRLYLLHGFVLPLRKVLSSGYIEEEESGDENDLFMLWMYFPHCFTNPTWWTSNTTKCFLICCYLLYFMAIPVLVTLVATKKSLPISNWALRA